MSERSFFINGNQMPICARCFGIFMGVSFGTISSIIVKMRIDEKIHKRVLAILFIGYAPLMIDSLGQINGLWISINPIRLITGVVAGISFGLILSTLIDVIEKYTLIRKTK
ncbi:MAG: DUF2085 domain-containing protein [Candidatus Bathyarchaeia archaeon]